MSFGTYLSARRKSLGISQKDLADRLLKDDGSSISAQYLNDIEHDRRNPPTEDIINQLADQLQISSEYLLFLAGEIPRDLRQTQATPESITAAFSAFRKAIHNTK